MSSFFSGLKSPHRSGSGAHKSGSRRRRFGNHVRDILHLPRHAMVDPVGRREPVEKPKPGTEIIDQHEERDILHLPRHETMDPVGRLKPVERPKPGTEIIDQHEGTVIVRDDRVAYLVSRPIPEGKTLRKVVITVVSKDQGWSSYSEDHGTYRNSWSWFELSVGPSKDSEKWCGEVVRNLHAHDDFKEHTVEIVDEGLYEKAKSGDVLTVWALARYAAWKNTVKKVMIQYVVE